MCVLSMPTSGFGGDHLASTATIACDSCLFKQEEHTEEAGATSGLQTLVGPERLLDQLRSPFFCREHSDGCAIFVQGWATRLSTCPLGNIYQQPSFLLLFPAFRF